MGFGVDQQLKATRFDGSTRTGISIPGTPAFEVGLECSGFGVGICRVRVPSSLPPEVLQW